MVTPMAVSHLAVADQRVHSVLTICSGMANLAPANDPVGEMMKVLMPIASREHRRARHRVALVDGGIVWMTGQACGGHFLKGWDG